MRRIALLIVLLIVAGLPALAQRTVYVSPDVATDPTAMPRISSWAPAKRPPTAMPVMSELPANNPPN